MFRSRFLLAILITIFWVLLLPNFCNAVVVKTKGNLELVLDSDPLFGSEIIWMPGDSRSVEFKVRNKGASDEAVRIVAENTSVTGGLDDVMFVKFHENGSNIYGYSPTRNFKEFWSDHEITFGTVPADYDTNHQENVYTMIVEFDPNASNPYKEKTASFDLRIGFANPGVSATTVTVVAGPTTAGQILGAATEEGEILGAASLPVTGSDESSLILAGFYLFYCGLLIRSFKRP